MSDLITRVSNVIADFVNDESAFTILDISEKVKVDGYGFVRHRDVQVIARPMLDSLIGLFNSQCDYIFTDILVNTQKGVSDARLYHPSWFDPDDYTNRNQIASSPPIKEEKEDDLGIDLLSDDDDEDDDINFDDDDFDINTNVDKSQIKILSTNSDSLSDKFPGAHTITVVHPRKYDSRIEIPKSALEESGFLNEIVRINFHPNSIGISKDTSSGDMFTKAKPGWRLSKKLLSKSNLADTTVEILTFTNKIVIVKENSSSCFCDNKTKENTNCCGNHSPCCKSVKEFVEETIIKLAQNRTNENMTINIDDNLIKLGFDSLDIAELMMDVEDRFRIRMENEDFTDVKTLRDFSNIVQRLI